ncbi:hypothetical protein RI056_04640 [Komagataeibacter nataicola]|uniref:hypothetical protein n=1 Tax=Komagataeibacter nataicola TaxID=265960 RepID=UPI0028AF9BA2|nr:hypothetical protein [Komagataeibacter nataicola]WNM09279.1 hypothetical protein RI056_04640 [Komagataeibacter nataicola]
MLEQFVVGQVGWHLMARTAAWRPFLVATHTSLGVVLAAVFIIRVAWGLTGGRAIRFPVVTMQDRVARSVHRLLYMLLGGEIVFGYMARWSTGRPVMAFGVPINSPLPMLMHGTHSFFPDYITGTHGYCSAWRSFMDLRGFTTCSFIVTEFFSGCCPDRHGMRMGILMASSEVQIIWMQIKK